MICLSGRELKICTGQFITFHLCTFYCLVLAFNHDQWFDSHTKPFGCRPLTIWMLLAGVALLNGMSVIALAAHWLPLRRLSNSEPVLFDQQMGEAIANDKMFVAAWALMQIVTGVVWCFLFISLKWMPLASVVLLVYMVATSALDMRLSSAVLPRGIWLLYAGHAVILPLWLQLGFWWEETTLQEKANFLEGACQRVIDRVFE